MRSWARHLIIVAGLCLGLGALIPAGAAAFGTVRILGQRAEHELITRLALRCHAGQPHDGSCFESASLDNVAGKNGTWGAVGSPDNIPMHLSGGPSYWHCDDADYLDTPGYPHSRAKATEALNECRSWGRDMLFDGRRSSSLARTWPEQGAVAEAKTLLSSKGNVDVSDPGTGVFSPDCWYNGELGRAKCNVWEPFGYLLHVTEDFYSHSNWADLSDPSKPISIANPPGLGHRYLPEYWDLRHASAPLPDPRLSTGCFPDFLCKGRITHDGGLNKDKMDINSLTGFVSDPGSPRGKLFDNDQRAVDGAIDEARRQWSILRDELVSRYGAERGGKMICALTSDSANRSCNDGNRARDVFAQNPPAWQQLASVLAPRRCLDLPSQNTADGTKLQLFDCNGTAAQQFQLEGREVQFSSVGASPAARVMGKCLDAPGSSNADGTPVQIFTCNRTAAQRVTVTDLDQLQLLGKCLAIRGDGASNGAAVVLEPCADRSSQIWEFR